MLSVFKPFLNHAFSPCCSDLLSSEYIERHIERGGKTVEVKVSEIFLPLGEVFSESFKYFFRTFSDGQLYKECQDSSTSDVGEWSQFACG